MSRQEEPRKVCACGRGHIFTAPHMRDLNDRVDGKQVCTECKLDSIYDNFKDKK